MRVRIESSAKILRMAVRLVHPFYPFMIFGFRPCRIDPELIRQLCDLFREGFCITTVCAALGVSDATLHFSQLSTMSSNRSKTRRRKSLSVWKRGPNFSSHDKSLEAQINREPKI